MCRRQDGQFRYSRHWFTTNYQWTTRAEYLCCAGRYVCVEALSTFVSNAASAYAYQALRGAQCAYQRDEYVNSSAHLL